VEEAFLEAGGREEGVIDREFRDRRPNESEGRGKKQRKEGGWGFWEEHTNNLEQKPLPTVALSR